MNHDDTGSIRPAVLTRSLAEVAAMVPCSERWLAAEIRAGRFPARRIMGTWRMTDDDVIAMLDACRNTAALERHQQQIESERLQHIGRPTRLSMARRGQR